MDNTKKNSSFWDRVFDRISPLRSLQFSMVAVFVLMVVAVGSAAMWGLNHSAATAIVYDYRTIEPQEYVDKYGVSVLSYDAEKNIATAMVSEDVINTVLNHYLTEQENEISDTTIYNLVWRQKDNHLYLQMQSGPFRIAMKTGVNISFNEKNQTLDFHLGKLVSSEEGNVLIGMVPVPKLDKISIPIRFLALTEWMKPAGVAINSNEMLFDYAPDLKIVGKMIKDELEPEEVYLAWSYSLKNASERSLSLKRVLEGSEFTDAEVKDLLHIMIDDQPALSSWLAMLTDESRQIILKQWGISPDLISQSVIQKTRDDIKDKACVVYAAELLQNYKDYLAGGVGIEPDAIQTRVSGLDNSVITFPEHDRLLNTAIISSSNLEVSVGEIPHGEASMYAVDSGAIYDYQIDSFITVEYLQSIYPSDFPYVSELGTIRLYYNIEDRKPAVLVIEEDGTMVEISDSGSRQMMIESAERFVPGFAETPSAAHYVDASDEEFKQIQSTVSRFIDQGAIFHRYCLAADNYAFLVFSTQEQTEKIRSVVMVKLDEEWTVLSLDVADYYQYRKSLPTVNATIFPKERITDYTVRTIPQEGLNLLLDKARQINLAGENDTLQMYYYMDQYVYTRFSNGKDCVFETDENQTILSCRSVESARGNWDLPAFFVIQAAENE